VYPHVELAGHAPGGNQREDTLDDIKLKFIWKPLFPKTQEKIHSAE